jgi:exodeoxyribonuclease V alpha subunit
MRKGALGVDRINELLQAKLNPARSEGQPPGFRVRDKVMQLRNDYEREVFNGDLGEIKRIDTGGVVVDMYGREVAYDADAQDSLALAYASTIHKVQGSEFPAVVVVLHATHHVLLSRALLYTALTRAQRLVVLLGDERAMRRAVSNTAIHRTNSRLNQRLRAQVPNAAITPS